MDCADADSRLNTPTQPAERATGAKPAADPLALAPTGLRLSAALVPSGLRLALPLRLSAALPLAPLRARLRAALRLSLPLIGGRGLETAALLALWLSEAARLALPRLLLAEARAALRLSARSSLAWFVAVDVVQLRRFERIGVIRTRLRFDHKRAIVQFFGCVEREDADNRAVCGKLLIGDTNSVRRLIVQVQTIDLRLPFARPVDRRHGDFQITALLILRRLQFGIRNNDRMPYGLAVDLRGKASATAAPVLRVDTLRSELICWHDCPFLRLNVAVEQVDLPAGCDVDGLGDLVPTMPRD